MLPCCLVPDLLPRTCITPLVKPSGYCSPIEDHARLFEYSSALPSIYLFASCLTLTVFLTMPLNKSLHMDPHASPLVGPVTVMLVSDVNECDAPDQGLFVSVTGKYQNS